MSPESEPKLSERQIRFCHLLLAGIPAGRAYERAGYNSTGDAADQAASRASRFPKVREYIDSLRKEVKSARVLELRELLEFLTAVIRTPVGEITEKSPLAQEVSRQVVRRKGKSRVTKTTIKAVSKMDAVKQLAALQGWNKPVKIEHSTDDLVRAALQKIAPTSPLPDDRDEI